MTSPREQEPPPNVPQVHFAWNTKMDDGLSPATSFFQAFIKYTETFSVFTERDMLLFLKGIPQCCKLLASLLTQLRHLIARMMSTTRNHVYVVPVTEGTKQSISHLLPVSRRPRMIALYGVCERVCKQLVAIHKRRTTLLKTIKAAQKQPLAMTSPREQQSQQNVPRVHFAVDTKMHDGLSPATGFFRDFINHTETFSVFTEKDMLLFLKGMPHSGKVALLLPQLRHLIARMMSTTRNHIYVVPVMEGIKLPISHLPRMMALYGVCERVCKRLLVVYMRRIKRSRAVHSKQESNVIGDQGQGTKNACSKRGQTDSNKRKIGELNRPSSEICCKRTRFTNTC